jgi:hypothetical protein
LRSAQEPIAETGPAATRPIRQAEQAGRKWLARMRWWQGHAAHALNGRMGAGYPQPMAAAAAVSRDSEGAMPWRLRDCRLGGRAT